MTPLEPSTDPIWDVKLEMLKDYMYGHKGQLIDEVVQAPDKDVAVSKALKHNDMAQEQVDSDIVKVLSVNQWVD